MKAGRELDAVIADKVMGMYVDAAVMTMGHCDDSEHCEGVDIPHYSTDIAAAMTIIPALNDMHVYLRMKQDSDDSVWEVGGQDCNGEPVSAYPTPIGPACYAEAETLPLAICLAALKAVGVEVSA